MSTRSQSRALSSAASSASEGGGGGGRSSPELVAGEGGAERTARVSRKRRRAARAGGGVEQDRVSEGGRGRKTRGEEAHSPDGLAATRTSSPARESSSAGASESFRVRRKRARH